MMLDAQHGILRSKTLTPATLTAALTLVGRLAAAAAASGASELLLHSPAALEARLAGGDGSQAWLDPRAAGGAGAAAGAGEDEAPILSYLTAVVEVALERVASFEMEVRGGRGFGAECFGPWRGCGCLIGVQSHHRR